MFGMGGSEIIVILIVALLFLGPDKLPGAAKTISKGIRDIKKQSRALQSQIESDETIGGAIKDLKSALRGDELPVRRPPPMKKPVEPSVEPSIDTANTANTIEKPADVTTAEPAQLAEPAPATITLPQTAGDTDGPVPSDEEHAELAALVKPAAGTVAKGS